MATFSRTVTVDWSGPIMEGKGVAKAGTGAFNLPVTFPSRVGEPGGTNARQCSPHRAFRHDIEHDGSAGIRRPAGDGCG